MFNTGLVNVMEDNTYDEILDTYLISADAEVAGRVVYMADGHIVEVGPPSQLFEHPQSEHTKDFLDKTL